MSSGRSSVRKPQPQLHLRCFNLGHEGFAAPTGRIILLLDAAEVCETLRLRPPHFLAPLDEQPRNVFLNALNHGLFRSCSRFGRSQFQGYLLNTFFLRQATGLEVLVSLGQFADACVALNKKLFELTRSLLSRDKLIPLPREGLALRSCLAQVRARYR